MPRAMPHILNRFSRSARYCVAGQRCGYCRRSSVCAQCVGTGIGALAAGGRRRGHGNWPPARGLDVRCMFGGNLSRFSDGLAETRAESPIKRAGGGLAAGLAVTREKRTGHGGKTLEWHGCLSWIDQCGYYGLRITHLGLLLTEARPKASLRCLRSFCFQAPASAVPATKRK